MGVVRFFNQHRVATRQLVCRLEPEQGNWEYSLFGKHEQALLNRAHMCARHSWSSSVLIGDSILYVI